MDQRLLDNIAGIYVVTDGNLRRDRSHVDIVACALDGGATVIQLRAKNVDDRDLLVIAKAIRKLTARAGATFIVNDHVEVALSSEADGAHIGASDVAAADARALLGAGRILGISVATLSEAREASAYATYFGVGTVFSTSTKADAGAPIGLTRLAEIRAAYPRIPIVAIGGIGRHNLGRVRETGVEAAAVVSAIVCADDMTSATRELMAQWNGHPALMAG